MNARILLVDDEQNVLSSLRRQLRGDYDVDVEAEPLQAVKKLDKKHPYAAVISDYRMPKMNGIEFLQEVRNRCPDTTRMMLTGYADLDNAIRAVNEGHVFRFLTKPCEGPVLLQNVADAVKQFELRTAKKVLLEQTLKGSVELLGEITALVNSEAGERTNRVRRHVQYLAKQKGVKDLWRYDVAAMLSQLGTLILPPGTLDDFLAGKELSGEQEQMFEMHPVVAKSLIGKLPRLESIAEMIAYQLKGYDGSGTPRDPKKGENIPLGGRILRIALDYDRYLRTEKTTARAFKRIEEAGEVYDPELLYFLEGMLGVEARYSKRTVSLQELAPGMILHEDLVSNQGALLLRKSLELDKNKIDRIHMFASTVGIKETFKVLSPG